MNSVPNQTEIPLSGSVEPERAGSEGPDLRLDALAINTPARVTAIDGSGVIARRLMEMGVVPGTSVSVVKAAPLGDPIEIRVRGYNLALRRAEAHGISVAIVDSASHQ